MCSQTKYNVRVPRVLLLGYFGARNFGDEALLCDFIMRRQNWLKDQQLSVEYYSQGQDALAGFVEQDSLKSLVERRLNRSEVMRVSPRRYQALIAPGGSLLQDSTSLKSLLFYLYVLQRFATSGVRVFLLNQGLGPFTSSLSQMLTTSTVAKSRFVSLRDQQSYDWLTARSGKRLREKTMLSADPILFARFAAESDRRDAESYSLVMPRPTRELTLSTFAKAEAAAITSIATHLSAATGLPSHFLPLQGSIDMEICREAAAPIKDSRIIDPGKLGRWATATWSLIGNAAVVVSYRLHGLVAAAAQGVPAFGVSYDPKVAAFCREIGYPHCQPGELHNRQTLERLGTLWARRDEMKEQINSSKVKLKERFESAEARFEALW